MTNINDLIKSGFNRRQVGVLSTLGGSSPSESLVLSHPFSGPQQEITYDAAASPDQNSMWKGNDVTFIDFPEVSRQTGSAIEYDPESGLVYAEEGVYLNSLFLQLVPTRGSFTLPGTLDGIISIGDHQWLSYANRSPGGTYDFLQTTWMGLQSAGDTNTTPYIDKIFSAFGYAIRSARYTVVKLPA